MATLLTAGYERRAMITPPRRNPITLEGVSTPEFKKSKKSPPRCEVSPLKTEGIAKALFTDKGRRSFSLAYSEPEPVTFTKRMLCPDPYEPIHNATLKRKAEFTPTKRNPIIQEEVEVSPPRIRAKMTESSIFRTSKKVMFDVEQKSRTGLYFENMRSRVFNGSDEPVKLCLKKVAYRPSEAASLINYKDCQFKEEPQAKKPGQNPIVKKDLIQKGTLTGLAKVYSARILKSQVYLQ